MNIREQKKADQKAMQKLFDTSLKHIRKQGVPSYNKRTHACRYRAGKLSCGAAPFIVNYHKDMEGKDWVTLSSESCKFVKDLNPLSVEHSFFVSCLQRAHDSAAQALFYNNLDFLTTYEDNMSRIAEGHKLTYKKAPKK